MARFGDEVPARYGGGGSGQGGPGRAAAGRAARLGPKGLYKQIDGPESPDHGPLQPDPGPTELPDGQPLSVSLQWRQLSEKIRQKDHRMAIILY